MVCGLYEGLSEDCGVNKNRLRNYKRSRMHARSLRCAICGYSVSVFAPSSVEREQQMYDDWAAEHRRKGCPT